MGTRLRVGIADLGRRWPRYRRALAGLRPQFAVRAVWDPAAAAAEDAARQLGCAAAGGLVELLEREDLDALLLLGGRWFGLWPLAQACRAGLPVFCAGSPAREADDFLAQVRDAGVPVQMALAPGLDRLVGRLRGLLDEGLGSPRLVRIDRVANRARHPGRGLAALGALPLLAACARLIGAAPVAVRATAPTADFASVTLEFAAGQVGHITLWDGLAGHPSCRIEVVAERGSAEAERPGCLRWRDEAGRHALRLPAQPPEREPLLEFARALRAGEAPRPGIAEAHAALGWLRSAARSLAEDRRLVIEPLPPNPPP